MCHQRAAGQSRTSEKWRAQGGKNLGGRCWAIMKHAARPWRSIPLSSDEATQDSKSCFERSLIKHRKTSKSSLGKSRSIRQTQQCTGLAYISQEVLYEGCDQKKKPLKRTGFYANLVIWNPESPTPNARNSQCFMYRQLNRHTNLAGLLCFPDMNGINI